MIDKKVIVRATSRPFVSGRMDAYSPKRNEMREAEWAWRYGMQRERPPVREVLPDMRKTVAAILARRTA